MYLSVLEIAFQGMEAAKGKEWKTACPVSQYFYSTALSGTKNRQDRNKLAVKHALLPRPAVKHAPPHRECH